MSYIPNNTKEGFLAGEFDLADDTITCYLYDDEGAGSADPAATVKQKSEMTGVFSGSGVYAAEGGLGAGTAYCTLSSSKTITDGTFDAGNITGSGVSSMDAVDYGQRIAALVILDETSTYGSTTNPIVCVISSGTGLGWGDTGLPTTGNPVDLTFAAGGLFSL